MEKKCRICLQIENNMISIYNVSRFGNTNLTIQKLIAVSTGLEVSKYDNYSEVICQSCQTSLIMAYQFRIKCWDSNIYFKNIETSTTNIPKHSVNLLNSKAMQIVSSVGPVVKLKSLENIQDCQNSTLTFNTSSDAMEHAEENLIDSLIEKKDTNENIDTTEKINQSVYGITETETNKFTKAVCDLIKLIRFCYLCDIRCSNIQILQTHMQNEHNNVVDEKLLFYKCMCSKLFTSSVAFDAHITSNHQISIESNAKFEDSLICWRCCYKCIFRSQYLKCLKQHFRTIHKDKLDETKLVNKCKLCNKQFKGFRILKRHVAAQHVNKLDCSYCGLSLSRCDLIEHMYQDHMQPNNENTIKISPCNLNIKVVSPKRTSSFSKNYDNIGQNSAERFEEILISDPQSYDHGSMLSTKYDAPSLVPQECYLCHEHLEDIKALKSHLVNKHKTNLESYTYNEKHQKNQNITFKNTDSKENVSNEFLDIFSADIICNDSSESTLKVKDGTDSNLNIAAKRAKRRKCYLCENRFQNLQTLATHLRTTHKTKLDLTRLVNECEICQQSFQTYLDLRKHHINRHAKTSYICEICGAHIKFKQSFQEHVNAHLGVKPFQCEECDYKSAYQRDVMIHMAVHSKEKKYECEVCKKQFATSSGRSDHRRIHSDEQPFQCLVCGKRFKKPSVYKGHMLIHDVSRHVACKYCGKKYSVKHLRSHLKTHTAEKSHWCAVCAKGFIQKYCWRNHMKRHHSS